MENIKLNITSLVDVCMCLLITFMVSGQLIIEPPLNVKIPKAMTNEETKGSDKIIVYVTKDLQFAVDDLILNYDDIESVVSKKLKSIESGMVLIKVDRDVRYEYLLKIMKIAKKCNAKKITIATKNDE